jgi:hypothetical protein
MELFDFVMSANGSILITLCILLITFFNIQLILAFSLELCTLFFTSELLELEISYVCLSLILVFVIRKGVSFATKSKY